jgi:hypothetical protein
MAKIDADDVPLWRILYRFATGLHLDGYKREPHERTSWWARKPRHHRIAWRWSVLIVVSAVIYGILEYRMETLFVMGMIAPYGLEKIWKAVVRRVRPVQRARVFDEQEAAPFEEHEYSEDAKVMLADPIDDGSIDIDDDNLAIDLTEFW